jgi:hypothetical protein
MKTFGIRQGVEFIPGQDRNGYRKNLIRNITQSNRLPLILDRLWDLLLGRGKLLFYLHPTGKEKNPYRIFYFHKKQYRAYYTPDGDLEEVVVCYSYKIKSDIVTSQDRYRKMWITKDEIKYIESDSPLTPDSDEMIGVLQGGLNELTSVPNTLGWVPCVETMNYQVSEDEGSDEFTWIGHQIEKQDELERMVSENLEFFGNQTLIATRSAKEVMEAIGGGIGNADSVAARSGFSSPGSISTRKSSPYGGDGGKRIKKVVGNVRADERFGYIAPDPVTGDHNLYIAERRDAIRHALGGVPEEGNGRMTAFEVKSLFGRAAATARKKCLNLYDYGLCLILQMAIQAEEQIWRNQAKEFLVNSPKEAKAIIKQVYPEAKAAAIDGLMKSIKAYGEVPDSILQAIADADIKLPIGGIPPLGDPTVLWRWTGPVYEESSNDLLNKSIVGRNMAEDGVDRWSVLRFIYPDKTEEELKEMVGAESSIPFRRIQQTVQALQMLLQVQSQMGGLPNPGDPSLPLSASLSLIPSVSKIIQKLEADVHTSAPSEPALPSQLPGESPVSGESSPVPGESPVSESGSVPGSSPGSPYANYFGSVPTVQYGESLGAGVPRTGQLPQSTGGRADFPIPNVLTSKRRDRLQYQPISPRGSQPQLPTAQSTNSVPIPPDMASQPGLLRQLFPTVAAAVDGATGKKPAKPKKSKK